MTLRTTYLADLVRDLDTTMELATRSSYSLDEQLMMQDVQVITCIVVSAVPAAEEDVT